MNGRIYDPKLGRMLSPDPVTQAPENGQNYNRYTYANNNPLKYSDPSGFEFAAAAAACANNIWCSSAVSSVIATVGNFFGGNGCDRTCKERKAAHNWCKAQSACLAELRANTREKFRKRSAQVIMEATLTGQSYYFENGRAYLGDNTTGAGDPVNVQPVPGQNNKLVIDSTLEAWNHYINGNGDSVILGTKSTSALLNSTEHQRALSNIMSGNTDLSGNYGVNLEFEDSTYHIGDTTIHYSTVCEGGSCTTTFTGFVTAQGDIITGADSFSDPTGFGIEFGTPFDYERYIWKETFKDPGYK